MLSFIKHLNKGDLMETPFESQEGLGRQIAEEILIFSCALGTLGESNSITAFKNVHFHVAVMFAVLSIVINFRDLKYVVFPLQC